jgi:hypothetical protein
VQTLHAVEESWEGASQVLVFESLKTDCANTALMQQET